MLSLSIALSNYRSRFPFRVYPTPRRAGVPLVYELDDNLKVIPHKDAIAPLQGRYLGDLDAVKARIAGVANQTK